MQPSPSIEFNATEISREGPRRVYQVRIPAATVAEAAQEREALNRLAAEAASRVGPQGGVPSAIKLRSGSQAGDLEFELTVTYLPDLPAFDASQLTLESFTASEADLEAAGLDAGSGAAMLRGHLKRQVLDRLHEAYSFPLIPALVDREFAVLWKTAEADLGSRTIEPPVRASLAAEFREIAERRVRLGLVMAEIARRAGIQAPHSAALEDAVIGHLAGQAQVSQRRASVDETAPDDGRVKPTVASTSTCHSAAASGLQVQR